MADEVREFHLDGKQLAFLVISAIGLAVVVFLCGVMVGRGVRQPPVAVADPAPSLLIDPALDPASPEPNLPVATDGRDRDSSESLTHPGRLPESRAVDVSRDPRQGTTNPSAAASAVTTPAAPGPADITSAPTPRSPAATTAPASTAPGSKRGYAVQVNALPNAAEAERLVKKLKSKGYPSYSVPRGAFFRVRVGSYPTRGEALAVKKRLEKEERYKDLWVDSAP